MKRKVIASGVLLSLFSMNAWCDEDVTAQMELEPAVQAPGFQYFVGLRGGVNLIGSDNTASVTTGDIDSDDDDFGAFGALDLGVYTPNKQGRIYYSFEYHTTTTQFDDEDAYDINVGLHLLNADHIFRSQASVKPFVGLHIGYAFAETDSDFSGSYDDSGVVFGIQAGLGWEVIDDLGLEVGLRHTVLPSERRSWQAENSAGDSVTVETQLKGVTSAYLGATYRF
ncbi:outer membrane beta-barrel protein [Photobacterium sp. DNB23_23_1]|uniref:Porin family protein n=1 Tax=Photobacterium pectinilyticum TaxID=2906793 RepID=A0ABT1N738_9GAMM|nr:outer membrane beta-barrel protein [Photobacterium sp. ZSDE20]MCQ1060562.1 porin family protein [Photobacterium sp. ZSDE20]MDD1828081.1 porin family protein [Photobacterium sp. ZSDE20]